MKIHNGKPFTIYCITKRITAHNSYSTRLAELGQIYITFFFGLHGLNFLHVYKKLMNMLLNKVNMNNKCLNYESSFHVNKHICRYSTHNKHIKSSSMRTKQSTIPYLSFKGLRLNICRRIN